MTDSAKTTVYFDGACPLCRREIGFYRACDGADAVEWIDVADASSAQLAPDLQRPAALARFHVRTGDGRLLSGGAAFASLWRVFPGFRPLGVAFGWPPLTRVLDFLYDRFLRFRPWLQRLAARAEAGPVYPRWLTAELRSDHAGESGAVAIYSGILAVARDPAVRHFAATHRATEAGHLRLIEEALPRARRSLLVPLWRLAGFVTGFLPALFGANAVYATVAAVETFVDRHYQAQIDRLDREGIEPALRAMLERCRRDEAAHRDEAAQSLRAAPGMATSLWCRVVAAGSQTAVRIARLI